MTPKTLKRWVDRAVQGFKAVRLQVVHPAGDDEEGPRVVGTYDLSDTSEDALLAVCTDVLADAQLDCDMSEARVTFVIEGWTEDENAPKACCSTRVRCDPWKPDGKPVIDAREEVTRSSMNAECMRMMRECFNHLKEIPTRQQAIYDRLMQMFESRHKDDRAELERVYGHLQELFTGEAVEASAAEQREDRETMTAIVQTGIEQIAGAIARVRAGEADDVPPPPAANGHDTTAGDSPQ